MSDVPAAVLCELAALRARDVDRAVMKRINAHNGNCSTAQVRQWEAEAYRTWRERWPNLNALFIAHEPIGVGHG